MADDALQDAEDEAACSQHRALQDALSSFPVSLFLDAEFIYFSDVLHRAAKCVWFFVCVLCWFCVCVCFVYSEKKEKERDKKMCR